MTNLSDINVKISVDTSQATAALSQTESKIKQFSNTTQQAELPIRNLGKTLLGAFGVGLSVAGLVGFTKTVITAGEESQRSDARLAQIAKSMGIFGSASGQVTERLKTFADQQARLVGVDDDVIKAAQAKLLTFSNLAASAGVMGGAFDRATKATVDMAAAGFGEATQNAVQLGKALQDPIKGIAALGRTGITFTEQEKAKIKTMVESNHMLEAQDYVLKAIETQVGGTAAASATATDKMKVAFGQVEEAIGIALLPVIEKLSEYFQVIGPQIEQFFKDLNDPATTTGKNWAIITAAVETFNTAWSNLTSTVSIDAPMIGNYFTTLITYVVDKVSLAIALIADLSAAFGRLGKNFSRTLKGDFGWLTESTDLLKNFNATTNSINNRPAEAQAKSRTAAQQADARTEFNRLTAANPKAIFGNPGNTGGATKSTDTPAATVKAYLLSVQQDINKANETFRRAEQKADEAYSQAKLKAETARNEATLALDKDHALKVASIQSDFNKRFKDIIQQSMDILRNAFASGTAFDVSSTFSEIAGKAGVAMTQVIQTVKNGVTTTVSFWGTSIMGGVDGLLSAMRNKLAGIKDLQANAAALQGAGFTQAFIAQVVQAGPDVGNELAKSILASSPDTQKAMSETFNAIQDASAHGLDGLAKTIYDTQGLQTEAIKSLYSDTQVELAKALTDEQTAYSEAQAAITKTFNTAMADALETQKQAIKDANQALLDSLDSIEQSMTAKLLTFKGTLKAFAAEIAKIKNEINSGQTKASAGALAVPTYDAVTGLTTSGNVSAPGSFMNTVGYNNSQGPTVVVNATTNASPQAIADTAVLALKYGTPLSMTMA